jgi:hypothetical protein
MFILNSFGKFPIFSYASKEPEKKLKIELLEVREASKKTNTPLLLQAIYLRRIYLIPRLLQDNDLILSQQKDSVGNNVLHVLVFELKEKQEESKVIKQVIKEIVSYEKNVNKRTLSSSLLNAKNNLLITPKDVIQKNGYNNLLHNLEGILSGNTINDAQILISKDANKSTKNISSSLNKKNHITKEKILINKGNNSQEFFGLSNFFNSINTFFGLNTDSEEEQALLLANEKKLN